MVIQVKEYRVEVEKTYNCSRKKLLGLFEDKTFFRLTGADEIEGEFRDNSFFYLRFKDRGTIEGFVFWRMRNKICILWDVIGFNLPDELETDVTIYFKKEGTGCVLKVVHSEILNEESARMKDKAWTEILEDFEKELAKRKA